MGKVFKKKAVKRPIEEEDAESDTAPTKKVLKGKKVAEEPLELEKDASDNDEDEVDDSGDDDEIEDGDDVGDEEDSDEEADEEQLDFDFEAFPMEEGDRDGIINILTQIFLRTDIDTRGFAEALIAQSPFGTVVGPADDNADEDDPNVVYALFSAISVSAAESDEKFKKDIANYLTSRAKKHATKEVLQELESALTDSSTKLFINERLLNFPSLVVPPAFRSLRTDIAGLQQEPKTIIYIQKIRVGENKKKDDKEEDDSDDEEGSSKQAPPKKKKKIGKAEKKRRAAAAIAEAEITFDNEEDKHLLQLTTGKAVHFDFPVHMDVEPGSKFHASETDGKKFMPFRRVVLMDNKRFDAFLKKGAEA